jgi:hypothetical protein
MYCFSLRPLPLLSIILSLSHAQQCYYPNGALAKDDIPCNPSADVSGCCLDDSVCLSNGLCMNIDGTVNRGSCTDQKWDSPLCAQICADSTLTWMSRDAFSTAKLILMAALIDSGCGLSTCDGGLWSCTGQEGCDKDALTLPNFKFMLRKEQLEQVAADSGYNLSSFADQQVQASATRVRISTVTSFVTSSPQPNGNKFSVAVLAGVAAGVGAPLLAGLIATLILLAKAKKSRKDDEVALSAYPTNTGYYTPLNKEDEKKRTSYRDSDGHNPPGLVQASDDGVWRHELGSGAAHGQ